MRVRAVHHTLFYAHSSPLQLSHISVSACGLYVMYFVHSKIIIRFEALHGEASIYIVYLVCSNTMCVSTCQVEFVFRMIYWMFGRLLSLVLKRTMLLFNYHPGGRYRKLAGTTTLAYRMVINCTTAESVLELVSLS